MPRAARALAFALSLAACAPPPPPVGAVVIGPPRAAAPVIEPRPAAPPALEEPGPEACRYTTDDGYDLRFRPDAPPFAHLGGARAAITLSTQGPARGALARATKDGFSLNGVVTSDDLVLHPAHAVVLGGLVVPGPSAALGWKATAPGLVTIAYTPPQEVELLPGAGLDAARVPCASVGLSRARFEPRSAAPRAPKEREGLLGAGKVVPLSREHDAAPVAKLHVPKDGDALVAIVDARRTRSRVRWELDGAVVFGWVPTSAVAPAPTDMIGDMFAIGDIGLSGTAERHVTRVLRCPRELPLVAEVRGERRTVGSIAAGSPVRLLPSKGDLLSVQLPERLAEASTDARVGVLAPHVVGCAEKR
jgi:hypothetical protein